MGAVDADQTVESKPLPSFDELAAKAGPPAFPPGLLAGARTAACFYSAAFYGLNDVIHLHRAGVGEILLNDLDAEKLAHMRSIYPTCGEVVAGDAEVAARQLAAQNRTFDIVVCDPFTSLTGRMATDLFGLFRSLARRWYIFGITGNDLAAIGAEPTPEHLGGSLTRLHGGNIAVAALLQRSAYPVVNGVYWAVVGGTGRAPVGFRLLWRRLLSIWR